MAGPLEGVRVVDLTSMISGPLATMLLGDQGADVIKVEPPGAGDLTRQLGRSKGGVSAVFASSNRSKRSLVLDLKQPRGRELLEELVRGADVFVQNFRPGTAERMGIGEPALRSLRPDLIYVSINGFGESGPYADQRVYDPVVQALSGLADIQRDRDTGRPRMVRVIVPDKITALTAAQAITAALFARQRSGEGQHLRLAMLDATIAFLWPEAMAAHTWVPSVDGPGRAGLARDLAFETADGWITAGAVSDAEWRGLVAAVERPEWLEDERFATPGGRVAHAEARLDQLAAVLRERTSEQWLSRFRAAGVPCAPILARGDIPEHPQVVANQLIVESEHPHAGRLRQPRPAARFERTPASIRRPAPALGEHTTQILKELGLNANQLEALRAAGTIA